MVAYEKRSWGARVGKNLIFHFIPLKNCFKLLETYSTCINCQHQKMKEKGCEQTQQAIIKLGGLKKKKMLF